MRWFFNSTAFITGAVVMVLEMLGFRLLAPFFGYSIYVWGALIGIVMTALACGYFVGGRVADRYKNPVHLYVMILAAALYTGLIYFFYFDALRPLIHYNLMVATTLASLIIFAPPVFALSMVSPFVIGISYEKTHVGTSAGLVYALSTAGSIAGTFLSAFYLIPDWGTKNTLIFCFLVLFFLGVIPVIYRKPLFSIMLLLPFVFLMPWKDPALAVLAEGGTILFDKESRYTRIIVTENEKDGSISSKSMMTVQNSKMIKDKLLTGRYWDSFNMAPLIKHDTANILFLGTAAGASIRQLRVLFPKIHITAVEIDGMLFEIAKKYFGIVEDANLELIVADARPFLEKSNKKYDMILVDLFNGTGESPFYVSSKEFFSLVAKHLKEDGLVFNYVFDRSANGMIIGPMANTVSLVFNRTYHWPITHYNHMLIAMKNDSELSAMMHSMTAHPLFTRFFGNSTDAELIDIAEKAQGLPSVVNRVFHNPDMLFFLDEDSPIEMLSYKARVESRVIPD